jgi:hypothetical protein
MRSHLPQLFPNACVNNHGIAQSWRLFLRWREGGTTRRYTCLSVCMKMFWGGLSRGRLDSEECLASCLQSPIELRMSPYQRVAITQGHMSTPPTHVHSHHTHVRAHVVVENWVFVAERLASLSFRPLASLRHSFLRNAPLLYVP